MDQVLLIIGGVAAVWLAVSVLVAVAFGRVVRIADAKERARFAPPRASSPVPPPVRVPQRELLRAR